MLVVADVDADVDDDDDADADADVDADADAFPLLDTEDDDDDVATGVELELEEEDAEADCGIDNCLPPVVCRFEDDDADSVLFFCGEMDSIQSESPLEGLHEPSNRSNPLPPFVAIVANAICSSKVFHRQGEMDPRARRRDRVMAPMDREGPSAATDGLVPLPLGRDTGRLTDPDPDFVVAT